ncbi:DUF6477 family protein [Chachezhania antarctica]|uniref:DUF6477 family protein n=1 Tax=Chachezhania antarctica TaxID=2340860 RepID=UPI001F08F103|nr:DUF6477 family protein [Chachezhania antarctica]
MQDILSMLNSLRRPRLLIRAARFGAREYRRERHLQRILGYGALPRPATALMRLMELEREQDDWRKANEASYSLPRHLDLLIAIMGEAEILQSARASEAAKADQLVAQAASRGGRTRLAPVETAQLT